MKKQSILLSIHQAVNNLHWESPLIQEKAINICTAIFNQYIWDKESFFNYKSFAQEYFTSITKSKKYYYIKNILVENSILDCDNKYTFSKASNGLPKGYRFNTKFFELSKYSSNNLTFTYSIAKSAEQVKPTSSNSIQTSNWSESSFLRDYITANLDHLSFADNIDSFITTIAKVRSDELVTDLNEMDEFIYLSLNKRTYRYSKQKALKLTKETKQTLIKFNSRYYISTPDIFIAQKEIQRMISYTHAVFNLKNKLYYCSRNTTNNRLDYNLTGLKKELFTKITFKREFLSELDIANAQFAIAAYLNPDVDSVFIEHAQNGTLYDYVEYKLNLKPTEGKQLMFRIAFDKVKSTQEYKNVRLLFPAFMDWVDTVKAQGTYKSFANLLQNTESKIMIDGLLSFLIDQGYDVFPIHDAIRVPESRVTAVRNDMSNYLASIGLKCKIRLK